MYIEWYWVCGFYQKILRNWKEIREDAIDFVRPLARGESLHNVNIAFPSRLTLSAERSAAMNIHAGNDADNCGARTNPKETRRDYASLYARAFLEGPRGGCARNSVVNSTTIGGLENTIAITPRHGGRRNEWDVRARLAEADYAEGILSASTGLSQ